MPSAATTPRTPGTIALLACLAVIVGSAVPGGSGTSDPTPSAAGRSAAKAAFKKKFQDYGEEKAGRRR